MNQSILSVSITEYETTAGPGSYTVYKIVLKSTNKTWTVSRRYSEFEAFHKQLRTIGALGSAPFPPKKLSSNLKVIEERVKSLDLYVKDLLKVHDGKIWTNSFVISFFEIDLPKIYKSNDQARQELLSSANPKKAQETFDSRGKSQNDLVNNQNLTMMQQDSALDQLSLVISRQKQMGLAISDELSVQNKMLDKLSVDVDQSTLKLKMTDKKLKKLI